MYVDRKYFFHKSTGDSDIRLSFERVFNIFHEYQNNAKKFYAHRFLLTNKIFIFSKMQILSTNNLIKNKFLDFNA